MKKFLIGLLALSSISTFAAEKIVTGLAYDEVSSIKNAKEQCQKWAQDNRLLELKVDLFNVNTNGAYFSTKAECSARTTPDDSSHE